MFPRGLITAGVLLLLLAATGFIYVLARPAPLVQTLEPERLELDKPQPVATPQPVVHEKAITTKHLAASRHLKTPEEFAVQIFSPSMAQTFVAPASVTLKAAANHRRELKGIEFYRSFRSTLCQSLSIPAIFPKELKIGEAFSPPYETQWDIREPGTFTIRAVATYKGGEQQISSPVVIIANPRQSGEQDSSPEAGEPPVARASTRWPVNRTCPDLAESINYLTYLEISPVRRINVCPHNPLDPANTVTRLTLNSKVIFGRYGNFPLFEYWTTGGRILREGKTAIWDVSELVSRPGLYTVVARADDGCDCTSIEAETLAVTNSCTSCVSVAWGCSTDAGLPSFTANVGKFAIAEKPTFYWTTTKGNILKGQGTSNVVVDTRGLAADEEFVVSVGVDGLLQYCTTQSSTTAVVGFDPCGPPFNFGGPDMPLPRPLSDPPIILLGIKDASAAKRSAPKPVRRDTQPPNVEIPSPSATPLPETHVRPRTNEKEWINISWTPRVKSDDSVTIRVVYNRSTESFQVSNIPGQLSEELKLGKLLSEWFGKDYQTFGEVRLRTAGLKCDSCNEEQFQSFDKEKLEWSWPLKPEGAGMQTFNIELWIKGEPRDKLSDNPALPAEKVWARLDNKVHVTEPFLTRNTVYAGGGLCAVLGLGLCVRGLKIYRVGDTYNVGQAVAVGRNVTMTNTTVNQDSNQGEDEHV